jgi:hypothetical protein
VPAEGRARPCPHDSAASKAAAAEVDALSTRIKSLPPEGNPAPLLADLGRLLEGPCFALARLEERKWDIKSSLSLRSFWESGGQSWVESFLRLDASTWENGRAMWTPPTPRRALTLEAAPHHPLAHWLLCSERDEKCGDETEPWMRRALTYFKLFASLRHVDNSTCHVEDSAYIVDPQGGCVTRALAPGVGEPYAEWRTCIEETAETQTALPLGRFRAPHDGWLLVRGSRWPRFCDEARAYDLATGAAYVARSCSGRVRRADGSIESARTDLVRTDETHVGRLEVSLLREAAWMMVLSNEAQEGVIEEGFGSTIPDGIEPAARSVRESLGGGFGSVSSAQTELDWRWLARGKAVSSGTITWPEDGAGAARDHAVKLLDIAEASLREGCAPAPLPPEAPEAPSADDGSPLAKARSRGAAQEPATREHLSRVLAAIHAKPCRTSGP